MTMIRICMFVEDVVPFVPVKTESCVTDSIHQANVVFPIVGVSHGDGEKEKEKEESENAERNEVAKNTQHEASKGPAQGTVRTSKKAYCPIDTLQNYSKKQFYMKLLLGCDNTRSQPHMRHMCSLDTRLRRIVVVHKKWTCGRKVSNTRTSKVCILCF